MKEKLKKIISSWIMCEVIGDEAMSQIARIFDEDEKNKNAKDLDIQDLIQEVNIEHKDKLMSQR